MNAIDQARKAYAPTQTHLRTSKSIEYQAFSDIIGRLKDATEKDSFRDLVDALHDNRTLWTILAADVADPDNGLPQQLRAQIFYLYEFTNLHSSKVLRGDAGVEALIDINTAILRGLGTSIQGRAKAQEIN
ncbi:flagellar biosynthesis regulator FlaF [Flavimaricola marinus]|uniref:Flagellar biosynthesis regulatory protein FlaF n=1 Tax=Flavimaricola marinus TaxID=1819565 RepID=A0A238LF31_9RHOB|nr:flagellar biosynthesis regulator FlaF [Flavimaricola marinus]SMY08241.1 flagellar biosynthesis regulatory protein FlaF [Flavimaricola marinus]